MGVLVFISLDLDLGLFGNIAAILVFKMFHLPLKYIVYIPIYILFVSGYVYPFVFLPFPFYSNILGLFLSSFLPPFLLWSFLLRKNRALFLLRKNRTSFRVSALWVTIPCPCALRLLP